MLGFERYLIHQNAHITEPTITFHELVITASNLSRSIEFREILAVILDRTQVEKVFSKLGQELWREFRFIHFDGDDLVDYVIGHFTRELE